MKDFFSFVWETLKIVVLALAIVLPIRYFIFQPFIVKGQSMEPNFQEGNYLIIDEISYRFKKPEREQVIVLRYPYNPSQRYLKRIIGLPGETVEIKNSQIYLTDSTGQTKILDESKYLTISDLTIGELKLTLSKEEYFVMGDNRRASSDSRSWGVLPRENIIGKVIFRLLPFNEIKRY